MLKNDIKKIAGEIHQYVVNNRRYLHAHPELSFEEMNTCAFIKSQLDELEIPWTPIAGTGVVAVVKGEISSGKTIALRADMDALPIMEENDIPYISLYKGKMHACGHDAHTASLLGTAKILQTLKPRFKGTVRLLFQPAEEKLPGGASAMIREGAMKNPQPDAIIGQHVMPSIECGKVAIRTGKFMASMDEIFITVHGMGGHGAQPHLNIDPVVISAHIIIALQQVVSRFANPSLPTVLSFGKVIAPGAINVVPDDVYMEGTFRTMDEAWRIKGHALIKKMAETIAESMGATCDVNIVKGYPVLINEEKVTTSVFSIAQEYLGEENVINTDTWMAAEDFAYYSHTTNACFYLLGVGNREKGITSSLHTPTFNLDEDAMEISSGLMAYIAVKLNGN